MEKKTETAADSRGAIRGRPCARRPACCAAPSAGSRLSASKAAPTTRPPPLGSYLLPSKTGSHAHPHSVRVPAPGPDSFLCVPSPSPGPDSFHPRGPICWEEPPTTHLPSHFLVPIPRPLLREAGLIEERRRADIPDHSLPPPSLQPPGFGEMSVQTTRKAEL